MKTIQATFDGHVFRPDEPVELPVNASVRLTIEEASTPTAEPQKAAPYSFFDLAPTLGIEGPPDLASRLDEYLYGEMDDVEE